MNQVLFRVGKSMELLSNQVWDPFPSRIDGKSMDLLEGLRSTMEGDRERAPTLLWTCSSEEEEAGNHWEGREKVYIYPPAPNDHLNHR